MHAIFQFVSTKNKVVTKWSNADFFFISSYVKRDWHVVLGDRVWPFLQERLLERSVFHRYVHLLCYRGSLINLL